MKMGRTTRSKNKRPRPEENADNTSLIFRKIIATGKVTEEDVHELYSISKPFCNGCRVNTKDNPNCFCGLIPPPNGTRKSGLWQKTSEIVKSLGPDPLADLRESPTTPAGLTNLGATCYANSILQCLYMNKSFRDGIFSVEPEVLSEDPVLNNLALLFAQLHSSKMSFVDSAPFIQTLQLDNDVQQDSHEFLTLLFSLLERCLCKSKVLKTRTIVQNLFRGGVSHVTRCSKCGNESEASSKVEDFYELELNVKGLKSLKDSLDDYFIMEELQGDNQYYCCACATRVDATRSIKLRSLPAVLNFQLKRCVFLPHATSKKKITSAFSFPGELNMSRRLSECSRPDMIYDLSAILIHKGSAVNSGHYIAHIKDENTNEWWEFDDENVSKMGSQPFGPTSSTKAGRCELAESSSSPLEQESVHDKDTYNCDSLTNGTHHVQTFSSSDAYMLMYVQRHSSNDGGRHKLEVDCPAHLLKEVDTINLKYVDSCEEYKSKKQFELDRITERRQEVRSILSLAPAKCLEDSYFWISSDWLHQWADSLTPSDVDNSSLQCLHGKVPVSKTNYMKRLSSEAWTMLLSKYHGGPTLAKDDYCTVCIFEMGQNMAHENVYMGTRSHMKELAEAALAGNPSEGQLYYISKSWLQQWLRRKIINAPCAADSGPTASIRCPHGKILPEIAPGAKRVLVPDTLWNFIYDTAMAVNPQDTLGCSTFIQDSEPCSQCTDAAFSEDSLREFKLRLRKNHEKLVMHKISALDPDGKYYLLPSSWLSELRTYINASGKNSSSAELETLNTVVDKLLCEKHHELLERPPELHWKRDLIYQKSSTTDGLSIIHEDDWRLLCEEFGGTVCRCISATIELDSFVKDENIGPHKEMSYLVDRSNMNHVNRNTGGRLVVKTFPQVCEECIGERESSELTRKLTYTNENIRVYLIRGKEPPKWLLEGSGTVIEPSRRTSKRSRKSVSENYINFKVSAYTSISQLKMMIWESFGVVKENQVLHKGNKSIVCEAASLADESIFPGDILWVADSKIHEDRDIADELSDTCAEAQKLEEGFRGTLLTSAMLSQVVPEACSN